MRKNQLREPRQAALLQQGLPPEIGAIVMECLDTVETERLTPLLAELTGLQEPKEIAARLSGCPAATVARLMRSADWVWTDEVLAELPAGRRRDVEEHMRGDCPKLAPAVVRAFCEHLWP